MAFRLLLTIVALLERPQLHTRRDETRVMNGGEVERAAAARTAGSVYWRFCVTASLGLKDADKVF